MPTVRLETPRPNRKRVYVLEATIHPLPIVLKCTVVRVGVLTMCLTQAGFSHHPCSCKACAYLESPTAAQYRLVIGIA